MYLQLFVKMIILTSNCKERGLYMSENILKQFLNENYGYIRTRDF